MQQFKISEAGHKKARKRMFTVVIPMMVIVIIVVIIINTIGNNTIYDTSTLSFTIPCYWYYSDTTCFARLRNKINSCKAIP
jgi:ABC-type sugar transport system permease subunit